MTELIKKGDELGKLTLAFIINVPYEFEIALQYLKPESFVNQEHKEIAGAVWSLYTENGKFDVTGIAGKINIPPFELYLKYKISIDYDFETVCQLLQENYKARIELEIAQMIIYEITKGTHPEAVQAIIENHRIESKAYDVDENNEGFEILTDWMNDRINKIPIKGIYMKHESMRKLIPYLEGGDLMYLAGRAGMGKTNYALVEVLDKIKQKIGVAFFSLEMTKLQLFQRLGGLEAEIPLTRNFPNGLMDGEIDMLFKCIENLKKLPLYVFDRKYDIISICSKCHQLSKEKNIKLIVIDYLQLMSISGLPKNTNREQQVSTMSRTLKLLAKKLNIPIIALSQLNRSVETRGGSKRPGLADLRESGSLEQDADFVCMVYRPEYYEILEDAEGNSLKGIVEILNVKNRHGELGNIKLKTHRGNQLKEIDTNQGIHEEIKETLIPINDYSIPKKSQKDFGF